MYWHDRHSRRHPWVPGLQVLDPVQPWVRPPAVDPPSVSARPNPHRCAHSAIGMIGMIYSAPKTLASIVGPVRPNPETLHVRDDQQARALPGERVLPKLIERGTEDCTLPLVLPREAVTLPHVRPAVTAGVLERAPLEAIVVSVRSAWYRLPLSGSRRASCTPERLLDYCPGTSRALYGLPSARRSLPRRRRQLWLLLFDRPSNGLSDGN